MERRKLLLVKSATATPLKRLPCRARVAMNLEQFARTLGAEYAQVYDQQQGRVRPGMEHRALCLSGFLTGYYKANKDGARCPEFSEQQKTLVIIFLDSLRTMLRSLGVDPSSI